MSGGGSGGLGWGGFLLLCSSRTLSGAPNATRSEQDAQCAELFPQSKVKKKTKKKKKGEEGGVGYLAGKS